MFHTGVVCPHTVAVSLIGYRQRSHCGCVHHIALTVAVCTTALSLWLCAPGSGRSQHSPRACGCWTTAECSQRPQLQEMEDRWSQCLPYMLLLFALLLLLDMVLHLSCLQCWHTLTMPIVHTQQQFVTGQIRLSFLRQLFPQLFDLIHHVRYLLSTHSIYQLFHRTVDRRSDWRIEQVNRRSPT